MLPKVTDRLEAGEIVKRGRVKVSARNQFGISLSVVKQFNAEIERFALCAVEL